MCVLLGGKNSASINMYIYIYIYIYILWICMCICTCIFICKCVCVYEDRRRLRWIGRVTQLWRAFFKPSVMGCSCPSSHPDSTNDKKRKNGEPPNSLMTSYFWGYPKSLSKFLLIVNGKPSEQWMTGDSPANTGVEVHVQSRIASLFGGIIQSETESCIIICTISADPGRRKGERARE